MDVDSLLSALVATPLAKSIAQGAVAFPMLECIHVVAIATVVGTIAIVDLRLLGYPAHRRGVQQLTRELLPFTWTAFAIAFVAGLLLFASNALKYAHNPQFQAKMALILAAGANMSWFHLAVLRRVDEWGELMPPPGVVRMAGGVSLCLWVSVVFLGRWVGFSL